MCLFVNYMEYKLSRFVEAQEMDYQIALQEMRNGRKLNHWIWYIFPQIKGLGMSYQSEYYGIEDGDEACAYLSHPLLGLRLREISQAVLTHRGMSIYQLMGSNIDAKKLCSSMTLFDFVSPNDVFAQILKEFYDGERDFNTLNRLKSNK